MKYQISYKMFSSWYDGGVVNASGRQEAVIKWKKDNPVKALTSDGIKAAKL